MSIDQELRDLDARLAKLLRRHKDVSRSIEQVEARKAKLLRERERANDQSDRRLAGSRDA